MGNLDNYTKFEELLRNGRNQALKGNREFINNEVNSEAMSILLFTSGTTSKSKAVMLNQKGLATNIADMLMVESLYPTDTNIAFYHSIIFLVQLEC